jgi:hypothetical protein
VTPRWRRLGLVKISATDVYSRIAVNPRLQDVVKPAFGE